MGSTKDEQGRIKSPLYDYYVESGVELTDFAGWALPIQFTGIQEEHQAVRERVGLFEASHMGEVLITGENVIDWLNGIITNDATKCAVNQAQYTAVVNEKGQTLDDLIFYRLAEDAVLVTPNGSNNEKIQAWFHDHNKDNTVEITDRTYDYGLIAVQGPNSEELLAKLTDADLPPIKSYHFEDNHTVAGVDGVLVSRTGYTGEDGFELYIPWDETTKVWKALLSTGEEYGITECGLGARDTLRLEGGMALYGNDLSEDINPLEGGIAFAVNFDKEDFIGKEALAESKADPERYMSRGFELLGKGIARGGAEIYETEDSEEPIGVVTSGTKAPTIGISLGYAMVKKPYAKFDNEVYVAIRKKRVPAKITRKNWLTEHKGGN